MTSEIPAPSVAVTIVTHNSKRFIRRCLESVLAQGGPRLEVVIVDNASEDGTRRLLSRFQDRVRVVHNDRNIGFSAAQNQAIGLTSSPWVLTLNPDVRLLPGFIQGLLDAGEKHRAVGTVCGKLISAGPDFEPSREPRIDSAGIYFTRSLRHFDRGWGELDEGRFDLMEYVFGASAAAAMYRREMIEDISLADGFFDPDFFMYREDADVAWRAQLMGWRCLYTPHSTGYHVRSVVPENRLAVSAVLNMHSVKNRFLMRIKNTTGGIYRRCWLSATARDLVVLGACLLYEQTSLPAFWRVARYLPNALRKRSEIMERRRIDDEDLARWFQSTPVAEPVPRVVYG
jgi:GT2 family glycosyltransferase